MDKKIIFFDWDGTLYSKEVSEKANILRTKLISKDFDEKELIKLQHSNNNDHYILVQALLKKSLGIQDDNIILTYQAVIFGFFYNKVLQENPEKYLLIDLEKLKDLKKKYNLKLIIVTSLWKGTFAGAMEIFNTDNLFDEIYCMDVRLAGNKTNFIKEALIKNSEDVGLLMIGDRGDDINAGKANGLKTIFCDYGHGSVSDADFTIKNPNNLLMIIEEVVKENV